jgi:hypothetical protein
MLTAVSMAALSHSPALGAMRAPLWVWIAMDKAPILDTDCIRREGKIAKHPGQGDKLFCDLPAPTHKTTTPSH